MPDPLSREEFEILKQIGILPVKMNATNHNEKSVWFCWDLQKKPSGFLL